MLTTLVHYALVIYSRVAAQTPFPASAIHSNQRTNKQSERQTYTPGMRSRGYIQCMCRKTLPLRSVSWLPIQSLSKISSKHPIIMWLTKRTNTQSTHNQSWKTQLLTNFENFLRPKPDINLPKNTNFQFIFPMLPSTLSSVTVTYEAVQKYQSQWRSSSNKVWKILLP